MDNQTSKTAETAKGTNRPDPPPPPNGRDTGSEIDEETRFFHPVSLTDSNTESYDQEEIEKTRVEVEQQFQDILKTISEETLQLSEFLLEENKLKSDLCEYLRQILGRLNIAFNISPAKVPLNAELGKVILNEKGHLILVCEDGTVNSAFLGEHKPETVMSVLRTITPELAKVISLYRQKISTRVIFFGKMRKELRNVAQAIAGTERQQDSDSEEPIVDATKESIQSDQKTEL